MGQRTPGHVQDMEMDPLIAGAQNFKSRVGAQNFVPLLAVLFIIIIVSSAVYYNSLSNPFQFDDEYYVSGNTSIRDIANIKEGFLRPKLLVRHGWPSGHYRPLVFASYALNYYFGGLNPSGYHLVNLFFHAGSAFLIFLIVKAMFGSRYEVKSSREEIADVIANEAKQSHFQIASHPPGARNDGWTGLKFLATTGRGGFFAALAAALIFLTTPFNSEVVNYITARSSVMCAFFYLLAFYFWIRFRNVVAVATTPYYLASLLFFLLAMLTKEIAITLPMILWLYDLYFVPVKSKVQHIKRLTAYLPFVLSVAIPYLVLRALFWGGVLPRFQRDIMVQLYTEMPVLVKYWRLLVFPVGLSIDHYTTIHRTFFTLPVAGSYALLMAILVLAIWLYNHKSSEWRIVSFFIIWFFVVLLPTTIFPLNTILQENRGYLAAVSFATLAGIFSVKVLRPLLGTRLFIILFSLLIVIYSAGTISRNSVWRDDLSLWNDAIAKGSESVMAYTYLSKSYIGQGEYAKAEELLKKSIKLYPYDFYGHYNLSWVYYRTNRYDEALKEAETALKSLPSSYNTYLNMGLIYYAMGNLDKAIEHYKKSLEFYPDYAEAHFNLGVIYEESGQSDLAATHYNQVIKNERLNRPLARAGSLRLKRLEDKVKNKIAPGP